MDCLAGDCSFFLFDVHRYVLFQAADFRPLQTLSRAFITSHQVAAVCMSD